MEAMLLLADLAAMMLLFRAVLRWESGASQDLGPFSFFEDAKAVDSSLSSKVDEGPGRA